ncbi:unnamed protein product [Camellia sinensis]
MIIIDMAAKSQAEIAQAGIEVAIDQDIGGLDVAVDDRRDGSMEGVDGISSLKSEANSTTPIGRRARRSGMEEVVESAVTHELDDQEAVAVGGVACETQQIDEGWAVELGEDVDFVVGFGGNGIVGIVGNGFFDGDDKAGGEEGLVDEAVAASAEKFVGGEAIGGGFEVAVLEVLEDFEWQVFFFFTVVLGFLLLFVVLVGDGVGGGGWWWWWW